MAYNNKKATKYYELRASNILIGMFSGFFIYLILRAGYIHGLDSLLKAVVWIILLLISLFLASRPEMVIYRIKRQNPTKATRRKKR